jgi:hypothetical protein
MTRLRAYKDLECRLILRRRGRLPTCTSSYHTQLLRPQFLLNTYSLDIYPYLQTDINKRLLQVVDYALPAMSDATLLLLCPSSTAECRSTQSSDLNISDNDVFPFLVHSQSSVTNGEAPEVDNGKLARQKRRRTRYVYTVLGMTRAIYIPYKPYLIPLYFAQSSGIGYSITYSSYSKKFRLILLPLTVQKIKPLLRLNTSGIQSLTS